MKKSLHSILTAAMFAAAVTTSVGSPTVSAQPGASSEAGLMLETEREQQGAYGPPNWYTTEPEKTELTMPITQPAYGPPLWSETESELTRLTETEPQDVYGPPSWFTETETTTITDVTSDIPPTVYGPPYWQTDLTTTTVTDPIPQPAYGPPWVFAEIGDINYDWELDARDLTMLKRALLEDKSSDVIKRLGDLNGDGTVDKEDVKALIRKLTGKPETEDEPEVTTTPVATTGTVASTTTDPWTNYTVPLYGPPKAWI